MIYIIFGSSIDHKPHSIFKPKSQEFQNRHIGLCSKNKTIVAGYFMGMHRDLWMRKVLQATISFTEFIGILTNNKFDKAVRYIQDNKSWERCYVLLKIMFPCLRVICLEDSNLAVMDKAYYYQERPNSVLRKQSLILIIRNYSQTYCHQPIYGTSEMTKVMKKSQYQMIVLRIQKIYDFSYQSFVIEERKISILIIL